MTDEERVLAANQAFYDAFAGRDFSRMDDLWARGRPVTCVHPGWTILIGRRAVMASWRAILGAENPDLVQLEASAFVAGEAAYVLCYEAPRGEAPALVATNVFVVEDDTWKMVHHQAGQLAGPPPEPAASGPSNLPLRGLVTRGGGR